MTSNRPRISAFFPAYNDGGTIGSLVVTTLQTLAEVSDDYEVIVIENGSTDYTVQVLKELAEQYDHFRYQAHAEPLGYGGALRAGFADCTKDFIFYTDGDAQYDPREVTLLLAAMHPGIDVVNAGKVFAEVPVHHYHRTYGQSQFFNFPRIWRTFVQLLQLWVKLIVLRRP